MKKNWQAILLCASICVAPVAAVAIETGTISYASGNCFVIKTTNGVTLFERSGGKFPAVGQKVTGTLDDFGYQQLRDGDKKNLMVGFVQEYGVRKDRKIVAFKKACR